MEQTDDQEALEAPVGITGGTNPSSLQSETSQDNPFFKPGLRFSQNLLFLTPH